MQLGMVGVGKMGSAMTRRLLQGGHAVVCHDLDGQALDAVISAGAGRVSSLQEFKGALTAPRVLWLMLPAGEATDATIRSLTEILSRGDLIVDGANSDFRNTLRNAALLQDTGIRFADVGVSGGIWGATEGYGLLVGGDPLDMDSIRPLCATLSRPGGFAHVGPVGSGHFAKMVHNGVEYAVMQAYAEGYELLAASDLSVDISAAVSVFATACSIRAWLLDHLARALAQNPKLEGVKGWVGDSGMGRWTIEEAVRLSVPIPAITAGLYARFTSRQEDSPAMRSIAALRQEVGGHKAKR